MLRSWLRLRIQGFALAAVAVWTTAGDEPLSFKQRGRGFFSRLLDDTLSRKKQREDRLEYGSSVNPPEYLDMMISPVFIDKRPDPGSFLGCFPCKNGMSWWTKFSCAVDDHCADPSLVGRLFHLPSDRAREVMNDVAIPRFVITRNPLIRALSGFLTWVEHGNEFNYVPSSFEGFVAKLDQSRVAFPTSETYTWSKNPHWRPQREYCGLNHGDTYAQYRAEDRRIWGSQLFVQLGHNYADTAAALNFSQVADQPNADVGECPGYFCHAKDIMAEYFTRDLFDQLRRFYYDDIKDFGYEHDVEKLHVELFKKRHGSRGRRGSNGPHRDLKLRRGEVAGDSTGLLQGLSPRQLARILDASEGIIAPIS